QPVIRGYEPGFSGMYPTEVRTAIGSLRMSCPSTSAVPSEGVRTVARIRRVVVLPAPLGPRNPKTSPLGTSKSTPLSASTELRNPAYRLLRPWTRMAQVVAAHLPPRRLAADRGGPSASEQSMLCTPGAA